MNKVTLHQYQSKPGSFGVKVMDETASLQDLLDAWQPLCDDTLITKNMLLQP
jgi:hypothetical protein